MKITEFQGDYRFLSNFWMCRIVFEGKTWPSSEHCFQAMKTLDPSERHEILHAEKPGQAKRLGKKVKMRPDWEKIKIEMMYQIVLAKFTQNRSLGLGLVATGDAELIEGNNWGDVFWGVCQGRGRNELGKILMKVRKELKWQKV